MKEGMSNQYGDLPWVARVMYLIYALAVIWLVFFCERIDSADTLTISAILVAILAVVAGLDAWKAYLWHLKSEADRLDDRLERIEKEESERKKFILEQSKVEKETIEKTFNDLFDKKLAKMQENLAKQLDLTELLRLAKELKSTTEEHYDSERKVTKTTTHFVPDDVRNKILNHFPRPKVEGEEQNDEEHE